MADNRLNQVPGYGSGGGGRHQFGAQNPGMQGMPAMAPYMQPGMPMNPMMQQQMMMAQGMRFPMQGMRMGPPNTPPPPYGMHSPNPSVTSLPNRPRTSLSKTKGGPQQSEKERFFEEQRRKLKQFGKPGATKVDADKLIGSMFSPDTKPPQPKEKGQQNNQPVPALIEDDDDGFGDFLQASATANSNKENQREEAAVSQKAELTQPEPEPQEEKKDLKSIMMEYSDLSAPKKAKGFHKPTLNEVQKTSHGHHKASTPSFHESDHSRSWKKPTEDLEGLFQLPVAPKPVPAHAVPASQAHHVVYAPQHVMGMPPASSAPFSSGSFPIAPPTGPPPAYSDVAGTPSPGPATPTNLVASNHVSTPVGHVESAHHPPGGPAHPRRGSFHLPEWCTHTEDQLPPVYKQVLEASIVDGKISTERLYPILLLSGLPREKLAQIWSLCNTTTPGQLIKNELWMVLALIALTQNNYNTMSLDILARCPVPPVPLLTPAHDTSAPATLPTTPQQHMPHPQPAHALPSSAISGVPTLPVTPDSSHPTPPHPVQHHQVHHPRPIPATQAVATTVGLHAPGTEDDEFADFQAAAPPAPRPAAAVPSKNEAFGEFIGGGSSYGMRGGGSGRMPSSSSPPTLAIQNNMGNGAVVLGNVSHGHRPLQQLHLHQQPPPPHQSPSSSLPSQQPPPSQPAQLSLASLPVDDKYGTNVRSFFCSSDSSTGHTSPSFDDDDLTDDRGSLSQVSTSEQSENEDIRNFETYVEEFNQKKEGVDGSPLHCPFPTIQQKQNMRASSADGTTSSSHITLPPPTSIGSGQSIDTSKQFGAASSISSTPVHSTQPGLSQESSSSRTVSLPDSDFADFKSAPVSSNTHTVLATTPVRGRLDNSEDDFADFKSATAPVSTGGPSSNDVSLMGDEDKYGALRVLDVDTDFSKPSLFESPAQTITDAGDPEGGATEGEDDWADFSTAPSITSSSGTGQPGLGVDSTAQTKKSGNKEEILKLFNSSSPVKAPSLFTSGASSDITSEGESKNGSLFGDDVSTSSTPSRSRQMGSSLSGDLPSSNSFTDVDPTTSGSGWTKPDTAISEDWAGFSSDTGETNQIPSLDFFKSADTRNDSVVNKLSLSGSAIMAGVSGDMGGDDWGDFSHSSSAASLSQTFFIGNTSLDLGVRDNDNQWGQMSSVSTAVAAEDDWSDFSAAGQDRMPGAGGEDEDGSGSNGNFVTIKKQNLGTNEIMGLFKVRDDPATLSSYQLPPQPVASKTPARHNRRSSSGSHEGPGGRRSSDFDDDSGPPPMDFGMDDDYDEHTFSRGYDLDDFMQQGPPATSYSPFGGTHSSPMYSRAGGLNKFTSVKESKEDSGSVHSLDLPSTKPADPSGSDSQSVSSADLTSSEMAGNGSTMGAGQGGVVSAESKSLDSLDLKTDPMDSEGNDGNKDEAPPSQPPSHPHHPIQPQELLESMPDFADKYNIDHEAQGSDRYGYQWERCLGNCFRIISEANTLFNTISSSSVCNEVLKSSQGSEYVTSVIEIYRVVCRVMTSMRSTAISTTELEQTLKNIDLAWNNLTAFLVGASLLPDQSSLVFTNAQLKSDSDQAKQLACGLCLLSVDTKPLSSSSSTPGTTAINASKLTYAGRQYHATCANFWVNCVDQTLPSLTLPELF